MVHIGDNLSHAILQSVKDTAHRFENSEGGGKEWLSLLEEIYSSLGTNVPNLDGEVITDLKEFYLHDGGDYERVAQLAFRGSGPLAIINGQGEPIRGWSVGTSEQIMTSRHTAWFLERLRSLCIETEEERSGIRGVTLSSDWCRNPPHFQVLDAFLTAPDGVETEHWLRCRNTYVASPDGTEWWEQSGPTVSWRTLIEYLQFIREHSNWTTLIGLSYIERINRSHELLMEGSAHDRFNEELDEQDEDRATLFVIDRNGVQVTTEEQEQEQEQDTATQIVAKKKQVRELLDFLEEKASKSELQEEKYREYAGLLMEVFQGLGAVTNV